jgi:hypothetical protein
LRSGFAFKRALLRALKALKKKNERRSAKI